MTAWEEAIRFVLSYEGGWVDDPRDNGGETFRGIARKHHPSWPGWAVVDGMKTAPDFPKNVNFDVGLEGVVVEFYRDGFWNAVRGEELPRRTALVVFDMAVNSGPGAAVRLLQSVLGVTADGVMGPVTVKAAHEREEAVLPWLFFAREDFYLDIMERKPGQRVWAFNWFKRLRNLRWDVMEMARPWAGENKGGSA